MDFKVITDYEDYSITRDGVVMNNKTNQILKQKIDRYGYPAISLYIKGVKKYFTIHRLVAISWIPNPHGYPQVNHLDGVKTNNDVSNLVWCNAKENITHSYLTGLNRNTNFVNLENIKTGEIRSFKSVKELSRFLNIYSSVLTPLIKYSKENPVLGTYRITLLDIENALVTANALNFGNKIYVYDLVNNTVAVYNSIVLASYFTGIRSLSNVNFDKNNYSICGYVFSREAELNTELYETKINDLTASERLNYMLTPYVPNKAIYTLYDYYTNVEYEADNLKSVADFLNTRAPISYVVNNTTIALQLGHCAKTNKTTLVKGYGLKSTRHPYDWFDYTEETIISSRYGKLAPMRVYRVFVDSKESIVIGTYDLCKMLNVNLTKNLNNITIDDVIAYAKHPNLRIVRLNKPIKNENIVYTTKVLLR